jgi:hypothetical protein
MRPVLDFARHLRPQSNRRTHQRPDYVRVREANFARGLKEVVEGHGCIGLTTRLSNRS